VHAACRAKPEAPGLAGEQRTRFTFVIRLKAAVGDASTTENAELSPALCE